MCPCQLFNLFSSRPGFECLVQGRSSWSLRRKRSRTLRVWDLQQLGERGAAVWKAGVGGFQGWFWLGVKRDAGAPMIFYLQYLVRELANHPSLLHVANWSDRKSVCSRVWCPGQLNLLDTKSEIVVSVHVCSETWRLLFSACSSLAMFAEARTGRIDLLWQRPMAGLATKQNDWAFGQIGIADWTKQCEGTSH